MLTELVEALRDDPTLIPAFATDPTPLYEQFAVTNDERLLVANFEETRLILLLTFPLFEVLQLAIGQRDFIFYPGFATLVIDAIRVEVDAASASTDLVLDFSWDHPGVPEHGLPAWFQVRVSDAGGNEIQVDTRYDVPTLLDMWTQQGRIRRRLTTPAAGAYSVVLDCGHPELRPSAPFGIPL